MRLLIAFALFMLLPLTAQPYSADDFSLDITLTRGERSRDSHSQTTRIRLKGGELVYEKSYTGYRGGARSVPVKKSIRLKPEDVERLKKLVRENELLTSDALSLAIAESGVRRYFEIALNISLDGRKSDIRISSPRNAASIKEKRIYQKAYALLDALYAMLKEQDKEIGYENRDLIDGTTP